MLNISLNYSINLFIKKQISNFAMRLGRVAKRLDKG